MIDMTCVQCGADLHEEAQEVCWTLTSQRFTTTPTCPPNVICTNWDSAESHFEFQKDCHIECAYCTTHVTPAQDAELRRLMEEG